MSKKNVVAKAPKTTTAAKAPTTKPEAAKPEAAKVAAVKRPVVKVEAARNCPPTTKLEWLVKTNPKRPGSASHERASLYWNKPTVADYLAAGATRADLGWDADHGFLALKA